MVGTGQRAVKWARHGLCLQRASVPSRGGRRQDRSELKLWEQRRPLKKRGERERRKRRLGMEVLVTILPGGQGEKEPSVQEECALVGPVKELGR